MEQGIDSVKERRFFPRVNAIFPVQLPSDIIGETVNLSESGLCLALQRPLLSAFIVTAVLKSPFSLDLKIPTEVVWSDTSNRDNRFYCGVKFLRLHENDTSYLRETLLKYSYLDKSFILLTKELRLFLYEVKGKFDEIDREQTTEENRTTHIKKHQEEIFNRLNLHFEQVWKIVKDLSKEEYNLHKQYYQKMIGPLLLEPIEINRYIYEKPLGYPGDFITMNYIYDYHNKRYLGSSSFERIINYYTCNIPISSSNIKRKDFFKKEILKLLKIKKEPKILSVGSGPARELIELLHEERINKFLFFDCLDFEKRALDYVKAELTKIEPYKKKNLFINFFNMNLLDLIKNKNCTGLKTYDLIYSSGVFDYLSSRIASRLLQRLFAFLGKSAYLIICNASKEEASHRVYYEMLGEWSFFHRDQTEMLTWARRITEPKQVEFIDSGADNYLFLRLKKH